MSLRFFNINSGQELTAETEPQIAALWGSSDRSPNVSQGQDFGWRFAPEVLVEMNDIKSDPAKIQQIADRLRKLYEDVSESDIMFWISSKTDAANAPIATIEDYKEDYDKAVRRAEAARKAAEKKAVEPVKEEPLETIEELRERAALLREISQLESGENNVTTTTTTSAKIKS